MFTALAELTAALLDYGVRDNPIRVGSALIGASRGTVDLSSWLEQLAFGVLKPTDSIPGDTSAMENLETRLAANGITVDVRKVASAVTAIAGHHDWLTNPARMLDWLHQLAVDVMA